MLVVAGRLEMDMLAALGESEVDDNSELLVMRVLCHKKVVPVFCHQRVVTKTRRVMRWEAYYTSSIATRTPSQLTLVVTTKHTAARSSFQMAVLL